MITIVLPAFSGRRPTSIAAATAAPEEMPTGMPSSRATSRAVSKAVWLPTAIDLVDHAAIEDRRNEAGADALDLVRPRRAAGKNGRVFGFDRDHADAGLAGLQNLADAGDRAAGADAGDDEVDFAVRVVPDFFRRGAAMDFRIGGILELLRHRPRRASR